MQQETPFLKEEILAFQSQQLITSVPGVQKISGKWRCARCHVKEQRFYAVFYCASCHKDCRYCRNCLMMGRVSECTPLYRWTGSPNKTDKQPCLLDWKGTLSPMQEAASQKMVEAVANGNELLVWAVCGAGKTEILFKGIQTALEAGKKVCLASPRSDVVLELKPRLHKAFPETSIAALYGGTEDRFENAMLTIATTHQLLRFYKAFDVMIVDEVDAFPYSMDKALQYAVSTARKPESSLIYLTATPSSHMQQLVKKGQLDAVQIPQRYHGHPLPVPSFKWIGNWKRKLEKGKLPALLEEWIKKHLAEEKQAFLFVPDIETLKTATALLKELDTRIEGVFAEDPDRKEKVMKFRKKETPVIVTTTILERGVTIPNSDACVLGAEDDVFTESALVQICGRVGRHADFPNGVILFFHFGKTEAMVKGRHHIQRMNNLAEKR
ncbi:DEAD/DEAH box helicase [Metabacillus sp. GX 13764]|uniref:DEAD/DEAH box helicase n=1 Tax=Metabacillus kandeliae TaxID=2900151 RepID=UPI001E3F99B6|nr:DEAD/DEAH box helicase [Metabacillus kandeliae]MCD7034455.1 DEAD/DEAH box helicase [Metabacillus kandeliae]